MTLNYSLFMPAHMKYEYCPMCTSRLVDAPGRDGRVRPQCRVCQWTYYPTNLVGVNVVINTPDGVVFLMDDNESAEHPATLPGGSVEFGETPEDAAVRLARDSTGLIVKITRELGRHFERDFPLGPMLSFMFEAQVVGGKMRPGSEGHISIFSEGQFPSISSTRKGSQRALAAYLETKKWSKGWMGSDTGVGNG